MTCTDMIRKQLSLPWDPVLLLWNKLKIEVILGYKKSLRTDLGVMITSRKPQLTFLSDFFLRSRSNFVCFWLEEPHSFTSCLMMNEDSHLRGILTPTVKNNNQFKSWNCELINSISLSFVGGWEVSSVFTTSNIVPLIHCEYNYSLNLSSSCVVFKTQMSSLT